MKKKIYELKEVSEDFSDFRATVFWFCSTPGKAVAATAWQNISCQKSGNNNKRGFSIKKYFKNGRK